MYLSMGIREDVYAFGEKIWASLEERFKQIDQVSEYNQLKVIAAMQKNQVSEACLLGTTGYGYNDLGRDTLERVYADIFIRRMLWCVRRSPVEPMRWHWRL